MRRKLSSVRLPRSWQGVLGVLCIVAAVALLAGPAYALLTFGVFLVIAALSDSIGPESDDVDEPGGY